MGHNWFYSASMYQDFDPGTFKIKSSTYQDRTQIYKAAITKRYNGNRGEFTAAYHYANSHPLYTFATQSAPFIYVGDGSVKEYGDFKIGTTSYLPIDANITYRDMPTGELKSSSFYDYENNRSSEISLMNNYDFGNGLNWKVIARYDHARGALVYQTPCRSSIVKGNSATTIYSRTSTAPSRPTRARLCADAHGPASTRRSSTRCSLLRNCRRNSKHRPCVWA
jgi:uncharacterized membrane protein